LLGDRQRVHIGAEHEDFAVAVFQHANNAMPADTACYLDAKRPQLLGHPGSRLLLLQGKLRVLMQMAIKLNERGLVLFKPGVWSHCIIGQASRRNDERCCYEDRPKLRPLQNS
jgi:hypothetical protein